MMHGQKNISIL